MCSNWRCPVDPCCLFCCLQFFTITAGLSPDKSNGPHVSLTVCNADRSMGFTVNTLSYFCRVVECLLLMDTPIGCFPLRQIKALLRLGMACRIPGCSKWSESLSTESIGFTYSPSFPVHSLLTTVDKVFLYILMEKTLVRSINQIVNGLKGAGRIESLEGINQGDLIGSVGPVGPMGQLLCLERPLYGWSLEITTSLLENWHFSKSTVQI